MEDSDWLTNILDRNYMKMKRSVVMKIHDARFQQRQERRQSGRLSMCLTMYGKSTAATMLRLRAIQDEGIRRLMDREYMLHQQVQVSNHHQRILNKRIKLRELGELEREKKLILEGKMSLDDAPYIADHPVFIVSKMTNSILEEKRQQVEEKLRPKLSKSPDYELMRTGHEADEEGESFMELNEDELDRARKLWEMEKQIEEGQIFSQEDYDKIKYEEPLIKQLRSLETVEELYALAEEILGPVQVRLKNKKRHG